MTTENVYYPEQGRLSNLAGWVAGDLGSAYARLYASNTPYAPTRIASEYTEAAFPGYAPFQPVVWGAPFLNSDSKAEVDSNTLLWSFSGSSGSYRVFGIYLTDPGQTKLLAVVPFLSPFTFDPSHLTLSYQLQVTETSEL